MNFKEGLNTGCLWGGGLFSVEALECVSCISAITAFGEALKQGLAPLRSQHAMFREMNKLHMQLTPEPHLQVIPLLNFGRKVFQRRHKKRTIQTDSKNKLCTSPTFNPETSSWLTEWKGFNQDFFSFFSHTNQSQHLCWRSMSKRWKTVMRDERTVPCTVYCEGTCFKKANGVFEGWCKLRSAALKVIISWFI